jgi:hypothetical protein
MLNSHEAPRIFHFKLALILVALQWQMKESRLNSSKRALFEIAFRHTDLCLEQGC